jgi:hypothetical protein
MKLGVPQSLLKQTEQTPQIRERKLLGIIETILSMLWAATPAGDR